MSTNSSTNWTAENSEREHVLGDKNESLETRIKALITTWAELGSFTTYPSTDSMKTYIEFLRSHTLNLILSASWHKYQDTYYSELVDNITKCRKVFGSFKGFQVLCTKLVKLAYFPWKKKVIGRYLNCEVPVIDNEDYYFFAVEESAYFISMRLKKLCDDGCEDIALNLTRAYMKCCDWAEENGKNMNISDDQKKFVFDVYLALLYKFHHIDEMSRLLKSVTVLDSADVVRRFATKKVSVSKIWVNTIAIAHLTGTTFLTKGVMLPFDETVSRCVTELLNAWLPTYDFETDMDELIGCLRRIMSRASSSDYMYIFSKTLTEKFGVKLRDYNVEIYIQALNTDLNLLEKQKTESGIDKTKVDEVETRVANGLMELSEFLRDAVPVARECVLSAFSLKPSEECLRRIEYYAKLSGEDVLDTGQWKCKFHPPSSLADDLLVPCDKCGDFMGELTIKAVTSPNISLTEALQGTNMTLSDQLRDDLIVVIFCARYQLLSWLQKWTDLQRLCVMYLNDPVRTKNLITELKFVEIDYTPFLVKIELENLEYENQIETVISEQYKDTKKKKKRKRVLSSDEEDDDHADAYIPRNRKSDPDVLKTLRSFRRSLKSETITDFNYDQGNASTWYRSPNMEPLQSSTSSMPEGVLNINNSDLNSYMHHNFEQKYPLSDNGSIKVRQDIYGDNFNAYRMYDYMDHRSNDPRLRAVTPQNDNCYDATNPQNIPVSNSQPDINGLTNDRHLNEEYIVNGSTTQYNNMEQYTDDCNGDTYRISNLENQRYSYDRNMEMYQYLPDHQGAMKNTNNSSYSGSDTAVPNWTSQNYPGYTDETNLGYNNFLNERNVNNNFKSFNAAHNSLQMSDTDGTLNGNLQQESKGQLNEDCYNTIHSTNKSTIHENSKRTIPDSKFESATTDFFGNTKTSTQITKNNESKNYNGSLLKTSMKGNIRVHISKKTLTECAKSSDKKPLPIDNLDSKNDGSVTSVDNFSKNTDSSSPVSLLHQPESQLRQDSNILSNEAQYTARQAKTNNISGINEYSTLFENASKEIIEEDICGNDSPSNDRNVGNTFDVKEDSSEESSIVQSESSSKEATDEENDSDDRHEMDEESIIPTECDSKDAMDEEESNGNSECDSKVLMEEEESTVQSECDSKVAMDDEESNSQSECSDKHIADGSNIQSECDTKEAIEEESNISFGNEDRECNNMINNSVNDHSLTEEKNIKSKSILKQEMVHEYNFPLLCDNKQICEKTKINICTELMEGLPLEKEANAKEADGFESEKSEDSYFLFRGFPSSGMLQNENSLLSKEMRTFPHIGKQIIAKLRLSNALKMTSKCYNANFKKDSALETKLKLRDEEREKEILSCKSKERNPKIDSEKLVRQVLQIKAKIQLKECSVILKRLNDSILFKKKPQGKRGRPRKSKGKIDNKASENSMVPKINPADENFNCSYTLPLQCKNQQVTVMSKKNSRILEDLKRKLLVNTDKMNPRVVLKRLDDSCVKSLLAGVPGFMDTNLFRPDNTDQIVNVVQVAGGRATSTVPAPNTQTSTQVSPHIQRIGQPRNEKSDQTTVSETTSSSITKSSNSYTVTKPASTQSPTLINILSQQIIRPSNSNNSRRAGPLINIFSQQSVRPANTSVATKTSTSVTSETQGNSRIVASTTDQQQIINQIVNPGRTTGSLKTVVGTSNSEQGRIVQFICKSTDGKLIPVTSFPTNRLVKVGTTQAAPDSLTVEETYTKLVPNKKTDSNELSETLPKFQQAFGKSVYQNSVETTTNSTNITTNNANADIEKNKTQTKNSTVSMQPIQGGVIYTRQMPVGQTINLIPQTRGQVFRIATTNAEQISLVKDTVIHSKMSALLAAALQSKPKNSESTTEAESNTDNATTTTATTTTARVQLSRPALVQNARIVKPVLQIPSNVIRNTPQTNLSSTTLEQLREFDMVYKQVKERSSTSTPAESSSTTESSESSPQRISVTYLNQGQKLNCAPVVVVSSYSNLQPAASPALSVASQGSSSPCVTPAPTPTPVLPKVAAKSSKGKSVKNAPMHASKTSPIPKPQQKPQEDEHTTQRIFDILAEYAEQLRNSPDLNNKPAPRRRSNPPTNPSQNSKRKKNSSSKKTGQCSSLTTEADIDDPRTVGSEDSSCGVVQLSMQDEEQTTTAASTSESNDSTVTTRQQLILTDSSHNQTRNLIIADSSVGEALKMPNTAVLVPGNYIMPVSMVKGGQQIAVVSGGSKILATVPARSGPNMLLFQSFLNQNRKTNVPTVKYSTIQPISGISSQTLTGVSAQPPVILPPPSHGISTVTLGQPIAIKKLDETDRVNTELLLTISQSRENNCTSAEDTPQPDSSTSVKVECVDLDENTAMSDNSSEKTFSYQKPVITAPIATPVIAQTIKEELSDEQSEPTQIVMTLNTNPIDGKGEHAEKRVQSVLVATCLNNGPMLSHSPPQCKQSNGSSSTEQTKDDYLRDSGKRNEKIQPNTTFCIQSKSKKAANASSRVEREVQQICMQRRQAAIERELRLQKSLSEECEDLGVDEPSTSDLFPEALLFDSNNSPSFDQTSQDLLKRSTQTQEKEEQKLTLFSDDEFIFGSNQYQSGENQLCYEEVVDSRIVTNGQSGTMCEDNTLLQTCTSMSDVTLCSPISPENYNSSTPPPLNKYMHKYINKKKHDKNKQAESWVGEVSSSEDTTGSNELGKRGNSPDICLNKRSDEETADGSFKVVRLSISKTNCSDIHCMESNDCSASGRGARKSVKKKCPCCNGNEDNLQRKRPSTQQHANNPHKKAFLTKKR